jgi:hypothetical protein
MGKEVAGQVQLRSVGPIGFGPDEVLFVADSMAATIYASAIEDSGLDAGEGPLEIEDLDTRLASFLGCKPGDVKVRDLAVHPRTHAPYLSVVRGSGDATVPLVLRVDPLDGSVSEVVLDAATTTSVAIGSAPAEDDPRKDTQLPIGDEGEEVTYGERTFRVLRQPVRMATITDLAYVDGDLLVAGMSNEEFASTFRRIPFPFTGEVADTSLEIFHVSHGAWETAAPIRTFVAYRDALLASYTCTPVVHFPLADLVPGTKVVGRTVVEIGPVNQPLDMVTFRSDDGDQLLVANSSHGLIKFACRDLDAQEPLTTPQAPVGPSRETEPLQGVQKLANLGEHFVLALQADEDGRRHLRSLKTASL